MGRSNRPITMMDLARLANVSAGTVSRALQRPDLVKPATRERILALAKEHGFIINAAASGLRSGKTGAIGVIIPMGHDRSQHISDPFFMNLIGQLADKLSNAGYNLLLARVLPDDDDWLERMIGSRLFDGAIIIGQSNQGRNLNRVAKHYAPLVVWGQYDPANIYRTVGTDNVEGGRLAAQHLLTQGRKAITFLGDAAAPEIGARLQGVREIIEAKGGDLTLNVEPITLEPDGAHDQIIAWLQTNPKTDAIIAASDVMAMSTIRALNETGLSVPDDIMVVGFDDLPLAAHTSPPLTTVRQDIELGARNLVDLLFQRMAGEDIASQLMPPELVIRQSA